MGNRTCNEYTTLFEGYAERSGYNEIALIEEYKWGLTRALREKVYTNDPFLTTLKEWKDKACRLDRLYRILRTGGERTLPRINNSSSPRRTFQPNTGLGQWRSQQPRVRDPNAMDVDAMRAKGACFGCGKRGHIQRECPKRKEYGTRRIDIQAMSQRERMALLEELMKLPEGEKDFSSNRE